MNIIIIQSALMFRSLETLTVTVLLLHKLKREGIGNDKTSLCKWLKHSAYDFALVRFDRTLVVFQLSYPLAITQGLGGYFREVSLHH